MAVTILKWYVTRGNSLVGHSLHILASFSPSNPLCLSQCRGSSRFCYVIYGLNRPLRNGALIKKKIKFFSDIRKFGVEQLQSQLLLTAFSYMGKYFCISSYIRKPFLIHCTVYDFATGPLLISVYMRKIIFSFLSV
jgi:hypothetical protein